MCCAVRPLLASGIAANCGKARIIGEEKIVVAASESGRKELIMWELDFECTGDYGLSDCLFVTEKDWDYADAFFDFSSKNKAKEHKPINHEDDDFPF